MGCTGGKVKDIAVPIRPKSLRPNNEEKKLKDDTLSESQSIKSPNNFTLIQNERKIFVSGESFLDIYDVQEVIAMFPYAEYRKCIHKKTGLIRSVKIVPIPKSNESYFDEKSLRREVKALSKLDHPNILKIFDILADDKRFYIVMECWDGGLLLDKLKEERVLTEVQVSSLIEQLLSAVAYAHDHKVLHRDLSPNSICLMKKGNDLIIKIIDFGVSAFVDMSRHYQEKLGNSFYTAPEVSDEFYNEKCDLWSIGCIMYLLLTGKAPFKNRTQKELELSLKQDLVDVSILENLSISGNAILLLKDLLNKDFSTRISALAALQNPWVKNFRENININPNILQKSMENLISFHCSSKLKDGIQAFIASQIMTHDDSEELLKAFKNIDKNGDGKLSKVELIKFYSSVMGDHVGRDFAKETLNNVDIDGNGSLEFTEFLRASAEHQLLLSKKNLEVTFSMLDKDASGKISVSELQEMLENTILINNQTWQEIIREADQNLDGEIDMKEFYSLLINKF
ncbi:unnamed protein product [Blepharisma stoltei]|uniref:Calcium-dependent protein kinase n=1 Tax=Blepharisma stoltei TaxID=1481888 RepID=A0AAU9K458_9CILI|nr:unnamed protein product [Blepharisma stoltei]